jgi:superoxide dismutase, Fe-Mn family
MSYSVRDAFKPRGLKGISNEQIDQHWELYKGYVKNTNELIEELGHAERGSRHWSELKRRAAFELDGMVLHEHYFENLKAGTQLRPRGPLAQSFASAWKTVDDWRADFAATGQIRGVGWAIVYFDGSTGQLFNWWVGDHEIGHPGGWAPILVMDVWEHAYMVDHGANGRKEYVEAFMENVNWDVVERRFEEHRARVG